MPTELATVQAVHKPWGVRDLQPWSSLDASGDAIGELWFERADKHAHTPALLLNARAVASTWVGTAASA
jgi:mannose-6-phosphate isomerase